jgi:2-enoate reductase
LEPYFEMFKKTLSVPLIVAGSFHNPLEGERVLRDGKADFIAIGRGLLADSEYAKKVAEGAVEDIRKCRRCIDGCLHTHKGLLLPTDCSVNPELGKERKYEIKPAEKPKKVLIIGGGPAGMEAARVSALRGHHVTLYERGSELGGHLIPAIVPAFRVEDRWLIEWFSTQLKKLGVRIELRKEVSRKTDADISGYDAAIVATGAIPRIPEIPGVENAKTAANMLLGSVKVGNEILVVGGGCVGCETALYLAESGKNVKIIEMLDDIALDVDQHAVKPALIERMTISNVTWFTGLRVVEIDIKGVICTNSDGERKTFRGDTVVLAVGREPVNELVNAFKGKVTECYAIGDCVEPRKVFQAIHEGSLIARRI